MSPNPGFSCSRGSLLSYLRGAPHGPPKQVYSPLHSLCEVRPLQTHPQTWERPPAVLHNAVTRRKVAVPAGTRTLTFRKPATLGDRAGGSPSDRVHLGLPSSPLHCSRRGSHKSCSEEPAPSVQTGSGAGPAIWAWVSEVARGGTVLKNGP